MTSETKLKLNQHLDWRSKVLELSSQGHTEREIADIIKVNDTAVHRDLVYMRGASPREPTAPHT